MTTIADIRAKYPDYGEMTDAGLAAAVHGKFYSDIPRNEFDIKIGLTAPPAQAAAVAPAGDMSWMDVAKGAVVNAPSSAVQFGHDLIQPIIHPIETATAIKNVGAGLLQKIGILSGDDSEKYADAVGKFFVDRYGSVAGVKKAIATDPIGVLSDVSLVLTGGGAAAARAPGLLGKVGEVTKAVGQTIDPLNTAIAGTKLAGRGAATVIGGLGTHTGGKSLILAAKAGHEGGLAGEAFRENMRGTAAIDDVVTEAKSALDAMRQERGAEYRASMAKIGQDQTVLDFAKIDSAVQAVQQVKTYKGQDLSPKTMEVRTEIASTIEKWKMLDPKEFHTPEGIDALKQKIGDIRDALKHGTPERVVADKAYSAIRQTIVDQVPEYAKVMKGYEEATTLIKDIEKTLSQNKNASVDTSVRKLQSVLANNVNTNYGRREVLANYLVEAGAEHLLTKLAGQALSSAMPRGLGKLTAGGAALGGATGLGLGIPGLALAAAALPFHSPRIMGEVAHAAGRVSRHAQEIGRSAFEAGRAKRTSEQRK